MTKEERDALIASARKTPWLDTMKRRETEALLEALDDAEKRVRDIEDLRARIVSAMSCEPDDDSDLVEAVRENVRERDDAERERDAARAQLAALHAAASAVQTRARALPVSMTEIVHAEEWDDLDRTIADLATAAAEHERRVRASVEADRDQLAALHAAAQRFRDAVSDDGLTCRDNGLDSAAAVEEEWEAIDRVLADLATSAAEHERRVRAPVEAERDQFAAALAEVRDAVAAHREAMRYAREDGALEAWATRAKAITDAYERVTRALDAIPADLAAQRESRIRADERAKATLPLRNVLALSRRLHRRGILSDEDAGHFARFCASGGVEPSVLRDADEAERGTR